MAVFPVPPLPATAMVIDILDQVDRLKTIILLQPSASGQSLGKGRKEPREFARFSRADHYLPPW
ncbi:MAG: hypothetical protein DDT26_02249 [Dehalococcoidia bacterium]|nr:hypothetical protein [Chloroflexota bacterium]